MKEFTQKWAIAALLEDIRDGAEFDRSNFPVHITIAGNFEINKSGAWIIEKLTDLLINQKAFEVKTDREDMFGPDSDVAVMKIIRSPELLEAYSKIHCWLLESGAIYDEPQYQGEGYLPHSTYQKSGVLNKNETRQIKSVSLIDLFPNSDGQQRKVLKTINLS